MIKLMENNSNETHLKCPFDHPLQFLDSISVLTVPVLKPVLVHWIVVTMTLMRTVVNRSEHLQSVATELRICTREATAALIHASWSSRTTWYQGFRCAWKAMAGQTVRS
jgi:hypothetical protein